MVYQKLKKKNYTFQLIFFHFIHIKNKNIENIPASMLQMRDRLQTNGTRMPYEQTTNQMQVSG